MRTNFLIVMALCLFPLQACDLETDPFLTEVAAAERPAGASQASITHIVERYIPPGTPLQDATRFAEERGFKIYPHRGKDIPSGQKWFVATKERSRGVALSEETRLIIESDGTVVLKSRGALFLKGI